MKSIQGHNHNGGGVLQDLYTNANEKAPVVYDFLLKNHKTLKSISVSQYKHLQQVNIPVCSIYDLWGRDGVTTWGPIVVCTILMYSLK